MTNMVKAASNYMLFSSILAMILGLIMLLYPGGTMSFMQAAFMFFQIIISVFIIAYTVSQAVQYFKAAHPFSGVIYILIGIIATIFVWIFNVEVIFFVIAFFLFLTGITEIIGGIRLNIGRYFFILLGIINIIVGVLILKHPIILPLLVAWYVLFWGISRLLLALEIRKMTP